MVILTVSAQADELPHAYKYLQALNKDLIVTYPLD